MTSPSHKKHPITARPAKAKNRKTRWLLASALWSTLAISASAAEAPASSPQLKWRPARPAMATQSAEPGKIAALQPEIVQTAGTSELSGPSLLSAAPAYNATAQFGAPSIEPPTLPPTPAPMNPASNSQFDLPAPMPMPPANSIYSNPPARALPDANSQPMPAVPDFSTPGGIESPMPNPNNAGSIELPNDPKKADRRNLMKEDCDAGREDIKNTGLTQILSAQIVNLRYTENKELTSERPYECTVEAATFMPRSWSCLTYTWKASALCHKPLYFEEMSLERYGHSWGPFLDPAVSAAHFFGTLPILPYKMGVDTPCECQYALGYYRPGNCAPYMIEPFPISPRGAAVEAGFIVGAAAALP